MNSNLYLVTLFSTLVFSFLAGIFIARRKIIDRGITKIKLLVTPRVVQKNNILALVNEAKHEDKGHTLSIGITTFPARFEVLSKQVQKIRELDNKIDILLTVNSFYEKPFEREYVKKILNMCHKNNVYPIFFPKFSGLARMWNTLIRHMASTHILILNDDLEIENNFDLQIIKDCIQNKDFFTINNSFSHFVISLKEAITMNFFSERYLAFGEEDGDFVWRYIEKYNKSPEILLMKGINNKSLNTVSFDNGIDIEKDLYGGNKPVINTVITRAIYEFDPNGIKGMYDKTYTRKIVEPIQYPLESFIIDNWKNIRNCKDIKW